MAPSITSLHVLIMVLLVSFKGTMPQKLNIGVCYGLLGDNLPTPANVVSLFNQKNWAKVRIFDPNPDVLSAFRNSGIQITVGTKNADIPGIASGVDGATAWFNANIGPYLQGNIISYITVGNEVVPGEFANSVAAAMRNLNDVLRNIGLTGTKVTTVVSSAALANSYPPSETVFSADATPAMEGILQVLSDTGAPLMGNVYPYIAYASDPVNVRLDYAQFTATVPVVNDGNFGYLNLFDAMVDSFYWAMEKMGHGNVNLAVSETGWPSDGNGEFTTTQLAMTYNNKFKDHILGNQGTPKRPGYTPEGFVFALLNEDLKAAGAEQNFGLFNADMSPKYDF